MNQKFLQWFITFREKFAFLKVYLVRANSYIMLFIMGMNIFLVLTKVKEKWPSFNIYVWFVPALVLSLVIIIIFGWLDRKLGFHKSETEKMASQNPQLMEVLKIVKEIKKEK